MKSVRTLILTIIALAGGAWIGYAAARSDDIPIILGILFGFSFLLGVAGPSKAWLWAPLVAIWIPVLDPVLRRLGIVAERPGEHFTWPTAVAVTALVMVVSFAGAYAGAALAWAAGHAWPGASSPRRS